MVTRLGRGPEVDTNWENMGGNILSSAPFIDNAVNFDLTIKLAFIVGHLDHWPVCILTPRYRRVIGLSLPMISINESPTVLILYQELTLCVSSLATLVKGTRPYL